MRIMNRLLILVAFVIVVPALAGAGEVNLPRTGQTTCYDEAGNVIDCPGTGQDGDVQAGVAWPEPRFEDNGDGTVKDHLTGLIWLKDANCFGQSTWSQALTDCNSLASGSCGLNDGSVAGDWRLPNILELESLVNSEVTHPHIWLNSQGFVDVQLCYYWSATTNADFAGYAWMVTIGGTMNSYYKSTSDKYVWPVRAKK